MTEQRCTLPTAQAVNQCLQRLHVGLRSGQYVITDSATGRAVLLDTDEVGTNDHYLDVAGLFQPDHYYTIARPDGGVIEPTAGVQHHVISFRAVKRFDAGGNVVTVVDQTLMMQ